MYTVLSILLMLLTLELLVYLFVRYFRKDFQWLITEKDEFPGFSSKSLESFLDNKYSPMLGWTIKPGISSSESTGSLGALGGHDKKISFNSNLRGGRLNPGNEDLPVLLSTYGDSYAFCRQVEDYESWQWHLSNRYHTNVLNFGVGNFGIDQALIRMKDEYDANPARIVILEAVPETIVRIMSVWKHYYEYGNILAFKPYFRIDGDRLVQEDNPVNSREKFDSVNLYIPDIRKNDVFYKTKFRRFQFRFPYLFSFLRNPVRNLRLFSGLLIRKIARSFGRTYDGPWKVVLGDNAGYCKKMYTQEYPVRLLTEIIREFVRFASEKRFTPVLLILPFEEDLRYYRKHGKTYYDHFIREVSEIVRTVDLTARMAEITENLYTNSFYGSHLNAAGNKMVAEYLSETLDSLTGYRPEKTSE